MSRQWMRPLVVAGAILAAACGNTVGDPCTTSKDCGDQLCINRGETPGGYCSRQCVLNDPESCPSGSLCVEKGAGGDIHACFLRCNDAGDCRDGYRCRTWRDSSATVCVAES